MKILHVVTLLALAISAPVIAQPKDDVIGTTMYYLSIHHRIEKLKARAIKCTQETRIMQQKLQQQGAPQRSWNQLACQEVLQSISRIQRETFVSCVNDTDPGHDGFCYQYFLSN